MHRRYLAFALVSVGALLWAATFDALRNMSEEREAAAKENGFYPIELPGSIITDAWRKYMRPKEEIIRPLGRAKTIDDLEPEIRDPMRRAQSKLAERDDGHNDSPVT
jgi:hypothetical protein